MQSLSPWSRGWRAGSLALLLAGLSLGCGDSHSDPPKTDAGAAATGGVGGVGGVGGAGSAATGGVGGVGGGGGTGAGGTSGGAGGSGVADAATGDASRPDAAIADVAVDASDVVSCDRRLLSCRRAEPVCGQDEVPRIIGNCFGECVRIDECVCSEAADCPFEETYTCHRFRQRCGPYVN